MMCPTAAMKATVFFVNITDDNVSENHCLSDALQPKLSQVAIVSTYFDNDCKL